MGFPALLFRADIAGEVDAYGQDPVRTADGFSAVDDVAIVRKHLNLKTVALHFATDFVGPSLRENAAPSSGYGSRIQTQRGRPVQPIEFVHVLTEH